MYTCIVKNGGLYVLCSDWWRNYGAEQYGPDSVCLYQKSAFVMEQCTRKMTYPDWGSGCYKVLSIKISTGLTV